jgi:serine/threonine-protein kinase
MIGETISNYKILEKLGEGGMGVVYKAEDTKLKRTVALKFLPPHLAASEGDKARFIQEAQAASSLNHPNVCTIHDIQEHDGRMFIVMEFVQGQTLRDLMGGKKGADAGSGERTLLPLNRATEIGIQVADGLAAAHEKGIVHRDIKPENIMVRKDGIAQIMDFGLAKLRSSTGSRLTQQGSTVGTAGYMSPEQIQGTDADHRSDIFSLGVVLYELFTGELPFKGVHETALLYEIVNVDPVPMTSINPDLNPELDRIVFECLQKDPDERFQSVKDISKELKRYKRESSRQRATRTMATRQFAPVPGGSASGGPGPVAVPSPGAAGGPGAGAGSGVHAVPGGRSWTRFLWPALSLLLAGAVVFLAVNRPAEVSAPSLPVMRFPVTLSVSSPLVLGAATLAIAPDGKNFVYLAGDAVNPQLFLRPLDRLDATLMAGTEGASDPFFSDDGQWVAFFTAGKIKKVSIFGGGAQDVCDVPGFMRGGNWSGSNDIFFGHLNRGIFRVPASGGTPEEVTVLDTTKGEISHRFPQALPGGKWVLFTVKFNNISSFDDAVIAAENVETHERRELVRGGSYGRYVETGHLMYARGTALYAVPFDARNVEVTGTPLPVLEGGMLNPFSGTANFEVSRTGVLIYTPLGPSGNNNLSVCWMDRQGKSVPIIAQEKPYDNPRLSPDGTKLALTIRAANDDIWVYDIERGGLSRLTFGGGNSDLATWMPDGKQIVYSSERGRGITFFRKAWDGSGPTNEIAVKGNPSAVAIPCVTPDGGRLIYGAEGDLWAKDLKEGAEAVKLLATGAYEDAPRLSPDGRILAYLSNESGRPEIYAVPYPGLGGKWQISTGGAAIPAIWSPDGRELFYLEKGNLMKVDVATSPVVNFSTPRVVCAVPPSTYSVFQTSNDGRRFLVAITESSSIIATQVNVVVGWFDELRQKFLSVKK